MTREEIIEAICDDKTMPFIQPEQLANIVEFVIKNYQPSLPSNLDEAAEKEIERFCSDMLNVDIIWARMPLTKRFGLQMAKFGARWMTGQGVTKEAVIGMATEEISINVSQQTLDELGLCPGDKVVVQIRKAK